MLVLRENLSLFETDFEKLLLEAVDEGLCSLGDSSRQAIYYHMERSFNIRKEEIPSRIIAFTKAIEGIFGVGAHLVEILIMKKLHEKADASSVWEECEKLGFIEYVALVKRVIREKSIIRTAEELVEQESADAEL